MTDVKLSANLSIEVVDALRELAARRGVSMTEALRLAISHDKYFQDAVDEDKKILLEEPGSGRLRHVLLAHSVKGAARQ